MRTMLPAFLSLAGVFFAFALAAAEAAPAGPVAVVMKTSQGDITLELDSEKAPRTVANFLSYVDAKFYDGTIFHRVIQNFMIQGGGHRPDMAQKVSKPPIKNESGNGLTNARGTIAMAREAALHSATCQFYINTVDNFSLDQHQYCVFGRVVAGLDVVDAIAAVPTSTQMGYDDVPRVPVVILSIRRAAAR
ncbi:MAG: Peptidyl-prolyl cis-trans isomerase A precursor [Candidatus Aminicenantes bacterium ADurb.Bin147]|nr:MAG: Peptidyl-prolyl cis-trans isomerase A precursor [Candidatus Aminicenantes bacterium ADurb.Bin147]